MNNISLTITLYKLIILKNKPNCNERLELNEGEINLDKNKNNIKNYPDIEKSIKSNFVLDKNIKNNFNIPHKKMRKKKNSILLT